MPISSNIDDFNGKLDGIMAMLPELLDNTVKVINEEALNEAASYTTNTVPGINPQDGPRFTHPGGWADRTSNLVNGYDHKVERVSLFVRAGILLNTREYAVYLEKIGYWVLSGLFEGTIQAIARKNVANLARFIVRKLK